MEWENKNSPGKLRQAGLILLGIGGVMLALAIVFTMAVGTVLAPILMVSSILINTLAAILLRKKS